MPLHTFTDEELVARVLVFGHTDLTRELARRLELALDHIAALEQLVRASNPSPKPNAEQDPEELRRVASFLERLARSM